MCVQVLSGGFAQKAQLASPHPTPHTKHVWQGECTPCAPLIVPLIPSVPDEGAVYKITGGALRAPLLRKFWALYFHWVARFGHSPTKWFSVGTFDWVGYGTPDWFLLLRSTLIVPFCRSTGCTLRAFLLCNSWVL